MPSVLRTLCCATIVVGLVIPFAAQAINSTSLGAPDPSICLLKPPSAEAVDADSPGRWNNPERPGTGWELAYSQDRATVEAIWYTFDDNGHPQWLSTGPVQWSAEGLPDGVSSWSGPLVRHTLSHGQPVAPVQIGAVVFSRIPGNANQLAVGWQLDGQSGVEQECLVDRSEVGFGGESLAANLAHGWSEPGSAQYRVQWVVEPSRNGNSQT